MPLSDLAVHTMLSALAGKSTPAHIITHISLHSDDPGEIGGNEITGGTPSYSRAVILESDFDSPENRALVLNKDIHFYGPNNQVVTHMGIWDGTTWLGYGLITETNEFTSDGEYVIREGTSLIGN